MLLSRVARSLWIVGFLSACPVHQRWRPAHTERYGIRGLVPAQFDRCGPDPEPDREVVMNAKVVEGADVVT